MTSRLDELFSPERLRQNWQKLPAAPVIESQNKSNQAIHTQYHELQQLIAENFSDSDRLSGNFDELTLKINQTFPLDVANNPVDDKEKEEIVTLLEQLEELVWAMGLSREGV